MSPRRRPPPPPAQIPTLITGCSTGIGRATALRLVGAGFPVTATARDVASLGDLEAAGCAIAPLDIIDPASYEAVVAAIEREHGAVGALVNNAGYSQSGAVESVSSDVARRQLETNVIGPIALTRRALPAMRAAGWGRVINVSSMGGRLSFPGGGWYHASKHALEALSDVLRFEEGGFGVDVVLIEPGLIRTRFAERAGEGLPEATGDGPFDAFDAYVGVATRSAYDEGIAARLGGGPERVAAAIQKAILANHPRARMLVTPSARLLIGLHAILPGRAWDRFVGRSYPQPGPPRGR